MIFFERHLSNINSLVLSNKFFLSGPFIGCDFFVRGSNFVSTSVLTQKKS